MRGVAKNGRDDVTTPASPIPSFPRKRESRHHSPARSLDPRFRGDDGGGEGGPPPRAREEPASSLTPIATRLAGLAGALLGWRPAEFWAATPAELATALAPFAPEPAAPPDPAAIAALRARHPDG